MLLQAFDAQLPYLPSAAANMHIQRDPKSEKL